MGLLAASLLLLLALAAPPPAPRVPLPSGEPLPFVTIARSQTSLVRTPLRAVIRDETEWTELWRRHVGAGTTSTPLVDFDQEMVVAVFAGQTTERMVLGINRIVREPDRLVVLYTVTPTRPLPPAEVSVSVSPYHIVRLRRSSLPVYFVLMRTPPVVGPRP